MELLEKHFDTAFDALHGTEKLRGIILSLAMQGKLVSQISQDQSAIELLKDIEVRKQQLIQEKKLKKYKPSPEIKVEELPYQLPSNWKWCRWNDVALKIGDIDHKMPSEVNQGIPYVSPRDFFGENEINFKNAKKISIEDFERLRLKIQPEKFDIIFPRYGTLGVNRFVLVDIDFLASYSCAVVKNLDGFIDPKYSYYYSISPLVRAEIERYKKTTTQANVGVKSIQNFLYPLPPLAEQSRIVAKIDQLMARCDELEKLREARDRLQIKVHMAACDRLLTAPDTDTFTQSWQFITQHFSKLYSVNENVTELRNVILQLAVMGRLVPQREDDMPAAELLEKIRIEKQKLVREKKIKKPKSFPDLSAEEISYKLPEGWVWCRIWDIAQLITSGSRGWAKYYSDQGAIFVTMGNLSRDSYSLRMGNTKYVSPPANGEGSRTKLEKDDLLISITGDVGNLGLIPEDFGEAYINQHTCLLRFMPICRNRYFPEFMRSPLAQSQFNAPQRGIKNSFRLGDVGEMIIPLPPIKEQHRIVAKLDQLMTLCNTLEQQIDATTQKQTALLNAVTAQL